MYKVKQSDLIGQIKEFPIEIVQKMIDYQVKQVNKADVSIFQNGSETNSKYGGFRWDETEEGLGFWDAVIKEKNFDLFFKKYPKNKK